MDLTQQLQILIDDAPKYGLSTVVIQQAIAPVLEILGQRLGHTEYYILQNLSDQWVVHTISQQDSNEASKQVIYAFSSLEDAASFQGKQNPDILAAPLPITHILFRLFSLSSIDSMVFFTQPDDLNTAIELKRSDLQSLIQQQLKKLLDVPNDLA
ncbi:MAG TPA: hypothetical protein ACFCUY_09055 [Xenococcaceae cyanobacterium]